MAIIYSWFLASVWGLTLEVVPLETQLTGTGRCRSAELLLWSDAMLHYIPNYCVLACGKTVEVSNIPYHTPARSREGLANPP